MTSSNKCKNRDEHEIDWYFEKYQPDGIEDSVLYCKKCKKMWKEKGFWR